MKDMPAFPLTERMCQNTSEIEESRGLTKREYIATAALQGFMSTANAECKPDPDDFNNAAKWSVQAADALLAELARPQQ